MSIQQRGPSCVQINAGGPDGKRQMSPSFIILPLEVRNEIYSHVFGYDYIAPFSPDTGKLLLLNPPPQSTDGFYRKSDPQQILAILCVNHQISDEAAAYFYGKTTFRGGQVAVNAFIKGVGARRRDMIRSVAISHRDLLASPFDNGETFELLSRLPSLRKLRVSTSVHDFTQLQNELIRCGILKLAGTVDITVYNTYGKTTLSNSAPPVEQMCLDRYVWRCARGTTQWTGGGCVRKTTAQFQWKNWHWLSNDDS